MTDRARINHNPYEGFLTFMARIRHGATLRSEPALSFEGMTSAAHELTGIRTGRGSWRGGPETGMVGRLPDGPVRS